MERSRTVILGAVTAAVLLFIAGPIAASIYGEYLWFVGLDLVSVFTTIWGYRIGLGVGMFVLSFIVLYGGYRWAQHNVAAVQEPYFSGSIPVAIIGLLAAYFGLAFSGLWEPIVLYTNAASFGTVDPVLGKDLGFYVFELPVYRLGLAYLLMMTIASAAVAVTIYAINFGFSSREEFIQTEWGPHAVSGARFDMLDFIDETIEHAYTHISVYGATGAAAVGGFLYLGRYDLLQSTRGAVYGMGYTDQVVHLPLLTILAAGFAGLGLVTLANTRFRRHRRVLGGLGILVAVMLIGNVAGGIVQGYVVEPDEFNKERPHLLAEINHTRQAFDLDRIEEQQFPVSADIDAETLDANPGTVSNVRLWDWRPLLTTYNELQIFRTYYTFRDVDIDRYDINGTTRQVMTSPREIDISALPAQTQSWVNRHLVYTHGYGLTMSPVREVTDEGLPNLLIKDIPPKSTVDIPVDQPRIYYGEGTTDYAITNTGTRELDYPSGDTNVYTQYDGGGGVSLDSLLDRIIYAIKFGDAEIFFSASVTPDSDILFHREVAERVERIAPFLEYDSDPYIVVADGKLYWIIDAYTTSDEYPYSRPVRFHGEETNYIRNSVKVVVDAYTGDTTFYTAEDEPIIDTYERVFPELFEPFDAMPASLQDNVRYPEDLFNIQSAQYLTYHMTDPQVFYNKEDEWRIPDEIYRGEKQPMEPYYVMMRLPGEDTAEFVMIRPFIPRGKENMIGWLAARSDTPHYGSLKAFQFSKQELVFGPMQIESRIDQDTEISQRITLWSQSGSEVLRGNLLAIPIDDTILYVEPLFLQSRESGALPELKRVIVAHGDKLTMQPTLEDALGVIIGEQAPATPEQPGGPSTEQIRRAQDLYTDAQDALQDGDFARYAEKIEELGTVLETAETNTTTSGQ